MEQLDQNKKRENLQKEKNQIFRLLPRVDDLMKKENVQRLAEKEGYERVLGAVRDSVENLRNEISVWDRIKFKEIRSEPSFGTRTEKGDPTSL